MTAPAMTFDAAALMDDERVKNGPMVVLWNQDEEVHPSTPIDFGPKPKRKVIHRLRRLRPWKVAVRIAPPPEENLEQWGKRISDQLGVSWQGPPKPGDRAVFLPAHAWGRNAAQAIGAGGQILSRLGGFTIAQAQVRVEAWES